MTHRSLRSRQLTLLLVSAALLAFQIALLQILASSQWHHFAYLVIAVALLGFGVAGTLLALARDWFLARTTWLLPLLLSACAVTLAGSLGLVQLLCGGFDSYLLFVDRSELLRLAVSAMLLMLPFTCGALVIGIIFTAGTGRIGSLYCANMLGSGLGCTLGLVGLATLTPALLPPLCGLLALLAAWPLLPGSGRTSSGSVLVGMACVALTMLTRTELALSQYKDLRRALDLPGATVIATQPSSFGRLHIVASPVLRSATGLSLMWQQEMPSAPAVFVNGDMVGSVPAVIGADNPLNATTTALPFAIAKPDRVLVLNAGTGQKVALALGYGVQQVVAVEPHRLLYREITRITRGQGGATAFVSERVQWQSVAARTWLARDRSHYDLVMLPDIGSPGGSAGLFALHEQPLLTSEALAQAWRQLTPHGMLSITAWVDYPARNPLRLLATLVELLETAGVAPADHIVALRSWGTLTFCVMRSPLTAGEIAAARGFASQWAFDAALLPGGDDAERDRYNRLQDDTLFALFDTILDRERRQQLYRDYPFRIRPATDDRPFFAQFLRWTRIGFLLEQYGQRTVPFLELGILVAGLAAIILTVLAVLLVLLPLVRLDSAAGSRLGTFIYFSGLGAGYMWTELALIHRFEFYIGQPIYSTALVVAVLLGGSALGSMLTDRYGDLSPRGLAATVGMVLLSYALALAPLLQATLHLPLGVRLALAVVAMLPAALLMGMPFPVGLRRLDCTERAQVPWAWGINGCLSVVSAAFATLIAVETGYSRLLLLAAAAYLLAAILGLRGEVRGKG